MLAERMGASPRKFSGGMRQRVQIVQAFATRPLLLYLDEVTTGLDLSVQGCILDLIFEIQQEFGTAMIAVTHDLGVSRLLTGPVFESDLIDQILGKPRLVFRERADWRPRLRGTLVITAGSGVLALR